MSATCSMTSSTSVMAAPMRSAARALGALAHRAAASGVAPTPAGGIATSLVVRNASVWSTGQARASSFRNVIADVVGSAQASRSIAARRIDPVAGAGHNAWRAYLTSTKAATSKSPAASKISMLATATRRAFGSSVTAASAPPTAHPLVNGGPAAERAVGWWLVGGCAWVYSMVVLGGVTRLTRSGLSMTDWKFVEKPPMTPEDWNAEFAKYKESPEYKKTNTWMKLDDFKFIYWMEWGHRQWGRLLGGYFVLPLAYFGARSWVTRKLAGRLATFFGLGLAQGAIGWWMVKSGLVEDPDNPMNAPRVSPYRLATHLTGAFTIYVAMLWTTCNVWFPHNSVAKYAAEYAGGRVDLGNTVMAAARSARMVTHPLAALVGVTALSGAYVAGMDAGRAYNTFPLMDGKFVPDEYWRLWERFGWRNFFENTAAVQFDHRVLALSTLAAVTYVWGAHRFNPRLPASARALLDASILVTLTQVGLGISALLNHVPVSLGSLHQANALNLFTVVVGLMHVLRRPRGGLPIPALVEATTKVATTAARKRVKVKRK